MLAGELTTSTIDKTLTEFRVLDVPRLLALCRAKESDATSCTASQTHWPGRPSIMLEKQSAITVVLCSHLVPKDLRRLRDKQYGIHRCADRSPRTPPALVPFAAIASRPATRDPWVL